MPTSFSGSSLAASHGAGAAADSGARIVYSGSVGSTGMLHGTFRPTDAIVFTNQSLPRVPRIGEFRMPMAPGEWEELARAIRSLGIPRPCESLRPGTRTVLVGIEENGRPGIFHNQPVGKTTPAEDEVFSNARVLAAEVLKHPYKALEAGVAWETGPIAPDDDVVLGVFVRNPGLVPVPFATPTSGTVGASGFRLVLSRDAPAGVPRKVHSVELAPAEVVEVGPDGKKAGPSEAVIHLAPGKELRFRLRTRLRLPPGDYRGLLNLTVRTSPSADRKALSGAIVMELPALAVVRPGTQGGPG